MKWNNLITQKEIRHIETMVILDTMRWFLHPFRMESKFVGEGRERDLQITIIPMHRPYIACLA